MKSRVLGKVKIILFINENLDYQGDSPPISESR